MVRWRGDWVPIIWPNSDKILTPKRVPLQIQATAQLTKSWRLFKLISAINERPLSSRWCPGFILIGLLNAQNLISTFINRLSAPSEFSPVNTLSFGWTFCSHFVHILSRKFVCSKAKMTSFYRLSVVQSRCIENALKSFNARSWTWSAFKTVSSLITDRAIWRW